jgi:hypothetical protein
MSETNMTTSAPETTSAPTAPPVVSAPQSEKAPPKKSAPKAPPKKAPQLKLSARQRSNVDAFDNGAATSASVINHVLACAGRPLTSAEITAQALSVAPQKFDKTTAHGRVKNHLAHLLRRMLVENVGGAWRTVGAVGAATKQLRETAPAKLKALSKRGAPASETAPEAPPAS